MLRVFFEAVEKNFGASLESTATFVWTFGLIIVALQVLSPFARIAVQFSLVRAGLERAWVVSCGACSSRSPMGGACLKCGAELKVPALAKIFARSPSQSPARRRVRWSLSLLGGLVLLVGSFWLLSLAPKGPLERLFAGAALIAWAGSGAFLARAFGARGGGPVARLRELCFAGAALTALSAFVFLEQNVHTLPERVLGHVTASAGSVDLDGAKLQLAGPELGLELQLVEGMGMSRVLPLAWVGATRSPIELGTADAFLRDKTWGNAGAMRDLGVQVKRRTETFPVQPGDKYEVVLRDRDVVFKPVK